MFRKTLAALLLLTLITSPMTAANADREAELYQRGVSFIDSGEWGKAVRDFSTVIEMKGSRADGALYWMAYALARQSRTGEAKQAISTLKKAYPQSRWLDDAEALELEMRETRGEPVRPEDVDDDDLKMIAINSLMHTDPEKAYPLLEKIVRSTTANRKMKERALFILTQSPSPRAQTLISEIARGNNNPALQEEAVKYLGINATERNRQLLSEIYSSAGNIDVKEAVLQAFMIAGDRTRVLTAARGEKNEDLREKAIQLLGVMGARADLAALYGSETSREVKEKILQALFIAGDVDRLGELAKSEKDPELRAVAIRNLGLTGGKSTPILLALYAAEKDPEIKEAVIEGLFVQGNARALIDLSKKETNKELKREIVQKLSIMGNDEAVKYMLEILDEE
ncbi:MAG TPA: tetratricopeptide repeat protein [Thermoanaerobaculia bacterium]|nr:tetratricopeptide repeat protein [Thermoanaerobaculia bacterium]